MNETKRVIIDIVIIVCALVLFGTQYYQLLAPALQVDAHKMLIVSISIMVAHFVGRRIFGTVKWGVSIREMKMAHIGRLVFYAIVPFTYALCG